MFAAGRAGNVVLLSCSFVVQARFSPGTQRALLPLLIREVTGAPFLMKANVKWTLETSTPVSAE